MRIFTTITLAILLIATSFTPEKISVQEITNVTINWYSLEEAVEAQKEFPKKIFIDVYTDWCGWCKVMDNKTFVDPAVIKYMNKNFYAVKFDAEQKEVINFNGRSYKYVVRGRKGVNELAPALLDNQLSYPAFVVLGSDLEKIGSFKGYSQPEQFISKVDELIKNNGN